MKTGVAALAAGLVGGLGVLCFLLAFSTDYWLLASNKCVGLRKESSSMVGIKEQANSTEVMESQHACHHRELYKAQGLENMSGNSAGIAANQPQSKTCVRGYLFPLPVAVGRVPHHIYDATVVFRGFWTMLTVLAIVASITGGFLLVCAVPFISPKLYKVGGAFLIIVDQAHDSNPWEHHIQTEAFFGQQACSSGRPYIHYTTYVTHEQRPAVGNVGGGFCSFPFLRPQGRPEQALTENGWNTIARVLILKRTPFPDIPPGLPEKKRRGHRGLEAHPQSPSCHMGFGDSAERVAADAGFGVEEYSASPSAEAPVHAT
ncbi:hypothetical protein P4O66_020255 [Electrophorus voltai]|uniref:Transmembrane protein 182 n=1 Tax=Electrophorus voltai TaxID=2609070 RepID=A0AAD9E4K8_9TELE|nr:hypothetical protein P4O66_020255 [Electrophorus voltai]